jgi:alkaline phosphatase D
MNDFLCRSIDEAVAVGAVDARSARLWVRTTQPGAHEVEVSTDAERRRGVVTLTPPADADGTASFVFPDDVPGAAALTPGTAYQFRIRRGDVVLGAGRFETAPASPDLAPAKFAIALMSCHEPFDDDGALHPPSLETLRVLDGALRALHVKRVLLMGDQMYADYPVKLSLFDEAFFSTIAPPGRRTIHDCTRDEVRALYHRRYRSFWSIEGFRDVLASYPCYPVPDDHEVCDNFGSAPEHAMPAWAAVRDGAFDAFDDYQGLLTGPRTTPRRASFDYSLEYGVVGVYGLDVRSQRRHDGSALRVCTDEQFEALERYLRASSSLSVLILVTSVPLAIFPSWTASLGARLLGMDSDAADRWSHPDATGSRRRLTALLFEHQQRNPHQRVLLVGGDIHIGCAVEFVWRDPSVRPIYQLVSSSVSNLTEALGRKLGKLASHLDPHLHGGADDLWERVELLPGAPGADLNPFDGLNVGVVGLTRMPDGGHDVTFELISHVDPATPPRARAVFSTPL